MARALAAVTAAVALASLVLQAWLLAGDTVARGGTIGGALFVLSGYFTILTNLVVAGVSAALARGARLPEWLTAGTALWIGFVGAVYHLMLAHLYDLRGWWAVADAGLHTAVPLLYLALWAWLLPKRGLRWRHVLPWAAFPLAYAAQALLRGELTGWYPYPFLDVSRLGLAQVLWNAAELTALFLAGGALLVAAVKALGRRA
ncbi:MAG: Pr6Pr family membrane protein [Acetobacteraceae bacterium]